MSDHGELVENLLCKLLCKFEPNASKDRLEKLRKVLERSLLYTSKRGRTTLYKDPNFSDYFVEWVYHERKSFGDGRGRRCEDFCKCHFHPLFCSVYEHMCSCDYEDQDFANLFCRSDNHCCSCRKNGKGCLYKGNHLCLCEYPFGPREDAGPDPLCQNSYCQERRFEDQEREFEENKLCKKPAKR